MAFARTLGIPLADALQAYHQPITAIFIESCRAGLRLPAGAPAGEKVPAAARISRDEARELKKLAQTAFGFAAGERRLRADLGLDAGKPLTLTRLQAHVTAAQYQALMDGYAQVLRQAVDADVP